MINWDSIEKHINNAVDEIKTQLKEEISFIFKSAYEKLADKKIKETPKEEIYIDNNPVTQIRSEEAFAPIEKE